MYLRPGTNLHIPKIFTDNFLSRSRYLMHIDFYTFGIKVLVKCFLLAL